MIVTKNIVIQHPGHITHPYISLLFTMNMAGSLHLAQCFYRTIFHEEYYSVSEAYPKKLKPR